MRRDIDVDVSVQEVIDRFASGNKKKKMIDTTLDLL